MVEMCVSPLHAHRGDSSIAVYGKMARIEEREGTAKETEEEGVKEGGEGEGEILLVRH